MIMIISKGNKAGMSTKIEGIDCFLENKENEQFGFFESVFFCLAVGIVERVKFEIKVEEMFLELDTYSIRRT